jgi:hypothetical protein
MNDEVDPTGRPYEGVLHPLDPVGRQSASTSAGSACGRPRRSIAAPVDPAVLDMPRGGEVSTMQLRPRAGGPCSGP